MARVPTTKLKQVGKPN